MSGTTIIIGQIANNLEVKLILILCEVPYTV